MRLAVECKGHSLQYEMKSEPRDPREVRNGSVTVLKLGSRSTRALGCGGDLGGRSDHGSHAALVFTSDRETSRNARKERVIRNELGNVYYFSKTHKLSGYADPVVLSLRKLQMHMALPTSATFKNLLLPVFLETRCPFFCLDNLIS